MMIVSELPIIEEQMRTRILRAPKTRQAHIELLSQIEAMNSVELGGIAASSKLPAQISVVAWNLERCLFPEQSAAHLAPFAPDLVLLSEMDCGMARTAQRHTTAEMAKEMGMAYAYGVEFFEMGLGGDTELPYCEDTENARGWHGNAILSRAPMTRVAMLRLDSHGHWFVTGPNVDPNQPRVGGRMALLAVIETDAGPICAVSTHLESNADGKHRMAQFAHLLDAIDDFAPDLPVVIGGDLNTGNHMPPDFAWQREGLFDLARSQGYSWDVNPEGDTTRPSLLTPHPTRKMKLDWFALRGMRGEGGRIIPSVTQEGDVLSDHDAIWCRVHPYASKGAQS